MIFSARWFAVVLMFWLAAWSAGAAQVGAIKGGTKAGALRVYFVDVEGGQATLFVAPGGESLLIDTGWPGHDGRDANRIVAAAHQAGISRIDYVLITHFHTDHVGGVPQLLARIPVGTFIDHGVNREFDHGVTEQGYAAYEKELATGKEKHLTVHPGDTLPLESMRVTVVSGDGSEIAAPLAGAPGAGAPNPACATSEIRPADLTENARSLGVVIQFGALRILDLGDLTWDKERGLVCPVNKLGHFDLLVVSHHGWDHSSSPALIDALHARVAVMDNGAKKFGSTLTFETLAKAPGLEDLWQLHYSDVSRPEDNRPAAFIANPDGPDAAKGIEVVAHKNGSFVVINERTGFEKSYPAK